MAKTESGHRTLLFGALSVLILLALTLRLWVAWTTNQELPDDPSRLVGDEPGYDYLAWSLFEGRFFDWPGRTPVYPFFLALCYAVFGHSYASVLYAQAFVGAATVPLTYLLARRFTMAGPALLAAGLIAVHVPLIYHTSRLYTETLFTLLALVAVIPLVDALRSLRTRDFVVAGVALGVMNLCRPTGALFPLFVVFVFPHQTEWRRRLRLSAAYALAMAIVILPWTAHNWRQYGRFLPLSVSAAVLWHGSPEFYHLWKSGRNLIQIWDRELNPDLNGGHDPFSIDGDRHFTRRALVSIRDEPFLYLRYSLMKAAFLWIGNPVVDWAGPLFGWRAMTPYFPTHRLAGIFVARLLPLAAFFAIVAGARRFSSLLPLLALPAYFTLIHGFTYAEARHGEVLHPLVAIVLAAGIEEFRRQRRARPIAPPTRSPGAEPS